jgi:cardiolipin synthase
MVKPASQRPSYTHNNAIRLIHGGAAYFQALEDMIDGAQVSLHFQMYIFDADDTGLRIANALKRAALRQVKVHMMLDGYASGSLPSDFVDELRAAGVYFRWFQPLFKGDNFFVGRRMHHKVIVADAHHSLVSGRNISNRYNDLPGQPGWLDWAVSVTGDISTELYNRCVQMYYRRAPIAPARPSMAESVHDCLVRMRVNDWVRNKNQISRSYLEMMKGAQHTITIMSSYFMPGRVFRKNLRIAAKRGLRIRIILTKLSDVPIAKQAERFFYPWLLRRNIEIYEYRSKILHGKIACSDGTFVTVGSYNINDLSAYASIELNLDIRHQQFAAEVESSLERIIREDCDQITEE